MNKGNNPSADQRRPDRAALVIAAVLAAIAGVIFWDVSRLSGLAGYSQVGPMTVPYAIACCLIALAVWTAVEAWRGDFPEREHQRAGPVVWIVAGLAAQMLLLNTLGFSIATGILFALTARGFGKRKLWLTVPIGIVFSFIVWAIFAKLLQLSLPAGPLERLFF
ncbi:tripartite tricarboxylate transporter TctB family protein (plasmid) [Sinorhizobium meliloti]|uniref:tripartite tricarboxylate transporter TctB family protein n=2 Tax=Rhizobium meliloti TaxID=382 RepID=UPI000FD19AA7|nr:tripartite tricarboxylate transporter TctB family protein [Sinorhizobium meliloti]TWB00871.1 putative tricarboxylic transport membrane protein [Ensifer sp. SEMIA 134]TWB37390.1 putative tricarboxylic transport membrane protein [Ensifer sp. SEMIA 135]MDW9626040.1 tripartite tricarboxylate transporter TctB family protein [Sinorhizobium meliloti]MDW9996762.1 tripartite tricarboxylate transporter TctB family protein [Sinorhizobium meliloti]QGJ77708.1 tripartite tricarboxylate transporter TctB f